MAACGAIPPALIGWAVCALAASHEIGKARQHLKDAREKELSLYFTQGFFIDVFSTPT